MIRQLRTFTVELSRMVPGPHGFKVRMMYAKRRGDVEITVDVDKLLSLLGPDALASTGGKAVLAGGAVIATRRAGHFADTPVGSDRWNDPVRRGDGQS